MGLPYRAAPAVAFSFFFALALVLSYHTLCRPPSPGRYAQLFALTGLESILAVFVYRLAFHPLAKYPGPLVGALTDWYPVYLMVTGDRHVKIHRQHQSYGKFVRYGPNRISINSAEASRDISDVKSTITKADIYVAAKKIFGAEMSMTCVNPKEHAFRRRVNSAALTPAAVKNAGPQVAAQVDILMSRLSEGTGTGTGTGVSDEKGWGPGYDLSHALAFCSADIMSSITFSRTMNVQTEPQLRQTVKDMPLGVGGVHTAGHMHSLFYFNMHKLLLRELINGASTLTELAKSWALWRIEQKHLPNADIFGALLAARDPVSGSPLPRDKLFSEATLFIVAGTDTVVTTLCATIFYLLHNPRHLERLTREVRGAYPLPHSARADDDVACPIAFSSQELRDLPFVTACIDEAMRLAPPVPGILPRRVSEGGAFVDGEFFPEGVNLGVPTFSLHRDPEYFPFPLRYAPERWLEDGVVDGVQCKASSKMRPGVGQGPAFTPFGAGRASCLGRHLAYQEATYILARLVWLFDMRQDPDDGRGEGTGKGAKGRERTDEFQTFDRYVSSQEGPVVQFRYREELRG